MEKVDDKHALEFLSTCKWVKFVNILCVVREGLWCGMLTPLSKFRYVPSDIMKSSERSHSARMKLEHIPYWCSPQWSQITEVEYEHARFVTLMDVLTHSKVTSKSRSIVRVVAAFPWRAEDFCYRGEILSDGHRSVDILTRKRNGLLGLTVDADGNAIDDAPRNPPWVQCCLKSYYLEKNNPWETRQFRMFCTRHLG